MSTVYRRSYAVHRDRCNKVVRRHILKNAYERRATKNENGRNCDLSERTVDRHRREICGVLVTRERGKNNKLIQELRHRGILNVFEVPVLCCTRLQEGCQSLSNVIARSMSLAKANSTKDIVDIHEQNNKNYDWIVVTSPEGATILGEVYRKCCNSETRSTSSNRVGHETNSFVNVAVVGKATEKSLVDASGGLIEASFVPTKATGMTLALELPYGPRNSSVEEASNPETRKDGIMPPIFRRKSIQEEASSSGAGSKVLYCASERAGDEFQITLGGRGFDVDRIDIYTVGSVRHLDLSSLGDEISLDESLLTFASPSAVEAFLELRNLKPKQIARLSADESNIGVLSQPVVCIGETTARFCCDVGFKSIYYAHSPSIHGWANAIEFALRDCVNKLVK